MPPIVPVPFAPGLSYWQKKRLYRFDRDWAYDGPDGVRYRIHKGFETDFASVGRLLWWAIPRDGDLLIAAVVHDFGYRFNYLVVSTPPEHQASTWAVPGGRAGYDRLFYQLARHVSGNRALAAVAYSGVRAFGWLAWKRHRNLEKD